MILVTGATGNIGGEVARQLKTAAAPVRAFVRNRQKAAALSDIGIDVAVGDLQTRDSIVAALQDVSQVFLTIPEGPAQFDLLDGFLDAAQAAGIAQIVMLSGAEAALDSPRIISRWHWRMEQQIIASGIPYTFLRPVYIMQNVLEYLEPIKRVGKFFGPIAGDVRFSMVAPSDIAAVATVALSEPGHAGQVYTLTGDEELSFARVAELLGAVLHREVSYVQVPRETAVAQLMSRGQPDWFAEAIVSMLPPSDVITTTVADLVGRPPVGLEQYLRQQITANQALV